VTCEGVNANNMSEVRQHLKRNHSIAIKLCKRCNDEYLEEKPHVRCTTVEPLRKGHKAEAQWELIFRLVCPRAMSIPSPCKTALGEFINILRVNCF